MMAMVTIDELKQRTVPVVVANYMGKIVDVNEPFEQVFGWIAGEIIGQPLTVILPSIFHDAHNLGFARFSAAGTSTILNHPLHLKAITKTGQELESEHFIIAEKHNGEWLFAATLSPLDAV